MLIPGDKVKKGNKEGTLLDLQCLEAWKDQTAFPYHPDTMNAILNLVAQGEKEAYLTGKTLKVPVQWGPTQITWEDPRQLEKSGKGTHHLN